MDRSTHANATGRVATLTTADARLLQRFADVLLIERGLSQHTLSAYRSDITAFSKSLPSGLERAGKDDVMAYLGTRLAAGFSARSTARQLSALRRFYAWLVREGEMSTDPTRLVESPGVGRSLPATLTESEVQHLLAAPDVSSTLGLRDRAMLEMLYSSGLRVSELVGLSVDQLNRERGVVRVWGKGNKERLVPLGEVALDWLVRYERHARPLLLMHSTDDLFLSQRGRSMTRQTFWYRIKLHARAAGLRDTLSPHTLRHAFATHLVNHDADLRVVQLLLGHSSLSTTQIYTHVATERLKSLHQQHHPRG